VPLVNVEVIENVFRREQKTQMVERLTDGDVSIEGEAMRGVAWVVVEEVKSGDRAGSTGTRSAWTERSIRRS